VSAVADRSDNGHVSGSPCRLGRGLIGMPYVMKTNRTDDVEAHGAPVGS
jgi:hypothetical protein